MNRRMHMIVLCLSIVVLCLVGAKFVIKDCAESVAHVGVILPLSGPMAYEGERLRSAMELALANCSNKCVQLHYGDGKYAVRESVNAFRQLQVAHDIDAWIVWADLPLMGMREMLEKTGKPVICLIGAQNLIKDREHFIHFSGSIVLPAHRIANYAADHYLDSVSVIYHKEDIGEEVVKAFTDTATRHGIRVLQRESVTSENVDTKSVVSKVLANRPKAIFIYAYGPLYISILNQIKNQQYDGVILADSNVTAVRDKLVEGGLGIIYGDFDFGDGCQNPETHKFISDMKQKHQVDASSFSAFAYETIKVLCDAVTKYGKSVDGIERGFYEVKDYPSIVGKMTCVKNEEQIIPIVMKRIEKVGATVLE